MAAITVTEITKAGNAPTLGSAAGGGDTFLNDGRTYFHAKNGSGSPITVTLATPGMVSGVAIAEVAVSVPAGAERLIGAFDPSIFNDLTGSVAVTYSGVTSLTVGAFRLPSPTA